MAQDRRREQEDEDPQKIERHDLQEQEEQGDDGAGSDRRSDDTPSISFDRDIPGGQSD
jgi:hypothetical protein